MRRRRRPGGKAPGRRWLAPAACLAGILVLLLLCLRSVQPQLTELAFGAVSDEVNRAVNDTVLQVMTEEEITYEDLVHLEKDGEGLVCAVITDAAQMNRLQSMISNRLLQRLAEDDAVTVRIPLGNLFGGTLLSGRGPQIPVRILSVSSVSLSVKNDFTAAGINQTRHVMILRIAVSLNILLPGAITSHEIVNEIRIAETVIIGRVPGTYADLGGM